MEKIEKNNPGKVCSASKNACGIKKLRRGSGEKDTGCYWCSWCNRPLVSESRRFQAQ